MNTALAKKQSAFTVAVIGNPNTGKSTLFNALAGTRARVGNFPGMTVEKKVGRTRLSCGMVDLVDLPGTYSLSPRSIDEMVSVDVLLGRLADLPSPDAVLCIVDASNLHRNMYLVSQVLEVGLPTVLVLNMWDVAVARGIEIDVAALEAKLGIPVVAAQAHRGKGIDKVREAIANAVQQQRVVETPHIFPQEFYAECEQLADKLRQSGNGRVPDYLVRRMILDVNGYVESSMSARYGADVTAQLLAARERLNAGGCPVPAIESKLRYAWSRELLKGLVVEPKERTVTVSDRIDRFLTHRIAGLAVFALCMFLVFQVIFTWYEPVKGVIDAFQEWTLSAIMASMAPGAFRSLLVDGVIAGVGGVLGFLPQIAFLFFFIGLLEDCGYMARAAFLIDKLMTKVGLSGKSFVPLMSSFACAVPGIMATRVIENRRDRLVTILVSPLMSCSARLPVYLLLIAAFVPPVAYLNGWVPLKAIVLFAAYCLGAVVAIPVAGFLNKFVFKGEISPFVMEMPSYKWPSLKVVTHRVYDQSKAFVLRAGTLIFAASVLIWAAGYFPSNRAELHQIEAEIERIDTGDATGGDPDQLDSLIRKRNDLSGQLMADSYLGRLGHTIEPAVRPLGWDWKIGVGAIASFPAREVIIATMGTIYSLGGDIDNDEGSNDLVSAMKSAKWPDGRPVYNLPVALSIMVFFALCAQCAATLMVIKRETNSWRWPIVTFVYMTVLAYVGAFITYQVGMLFA